MLKIICTLSKDFDFMLSNSYAVIAQVAAVEEIQHPVG